MALIECPECGKEISDTAKICPECGYKIKKVNRKVCIIIAIIVIIIGIICGGKIFGNNGSTAKQDRKSVV